MVDGVEVSWQMSAGGPDLWREALPLDRIVEGVGDDDVVRHNLVPVLTHHAVLHCLPSLDIDRFFPDDGNIVSDDGSL